MGAERSAPSAGAPCDPAVPGVLLGVIGWPVGHSRSPAMQGAALAALGLPWRYVRLPVPVELLEETVRALAGSGFRGANVTIPHKEGALRLADSATPAARAIGAANTLTFTADGVHADNTDAGGLIDALEVPMAGRRALVLGAGGAGRAAAWALREAGAEVALWNRTPERAAAVAAELGVVHALDVGPALPGVDVLVNATSVGLGPGAGGVDALEALSLGGAEPPPVVVDLVYGAQPTPVERWARAGGARVVDGLEILVRQGARSLEGWTGRSPPLEVMRRAVRSGGT
ncbi:MAG: shikimate dehydrogenase [Thermoleophilaceae bacterium]